MLTQEDDVDAHALHKRLWSISAIARHLGMTARRSARMSAANVSPVSARRRVRNGSTGSSITAVNDWSRIRICGR
jgi:hypothetical protein